MRNYQARNFMRDQMQVGDGVLFYHSSCEVPGIAGLAEVASSAYPDATQFDKKSHVLRRGRQARGAALAARRRARHQEDARGDAAGLREHAQLADMVVLRRGNRLSITPVTPAEWRFITHAPAEDALSWLRS